MFIRCGRLCCLCLKQCGTNIEAAHIIAESTGGSNDLDNGIPLCLDCHQEIGAYNIDHPRGNRFRPDELIARRDRVYKYVESGVIYAQIVALSSRSKAGERNLPDLPVLAERPSMSAEAGRFLEKLISPEGPPAVAARKLMLLNEKERALVLDELQRRIGDNSNALAALASIVDDPDYSTEQAILLVEHAVRAVTLFGSIREKAVLLGNISAKLLGSIYEGLRLAFFEDLILIVERDQYREVNEIVPVLIRHSSAVPEPLYARYAFALLDQANSNSIRGAPAAKEALLFLPESMAQAAINAFIPPYLYSNYDRPHLKRFIERNRRLATAAQEIMINDFITKPIGEFINKYSANE